MDYRRERYDPPEGERDEGLWQIHFPLDPTDKAAFQGAAPAVVPAERMEFHTDITDGSDGETSFAIRVYASTTTEALEEAEHLVRKIRREAGLDPTVPGPLGHISPWWHSGSVAERIGKEAHSLHAQGRYELAVIRIQTACELHIANAVLEILEEHRPGVNVAKLIRRPMTLSDERTRVLMHLLTGRQVDHEPWWPQYIKHLKRRNAIVHGGLAVTYDESFASLEVILALRAWLLEVRGVDLDSPIENE
jgi:hypothetical protein